MSLSTISPIDGRYGSKTKELAGYFSEHALIRYRIIVEGEYLIFLSEQRGVGVRKFSKKEVSFIHSLYNCPLENAQAVKDFEAINNHDVKSVEYFLKDKFKKTSLEDVSEWIHFALTSEDVNNLAYALMLGESLEKVMLPELRTIIKEMNVRAKKHKKTAMLARTHGQPASPTTFGKEFAVFAHRLGRQVEQLENYTMLAKLNGASGNYNAHMIAYPKVNWPNFTKRFIAHLGEFRDVRLEPNLITTQIESHDTYAELFDIFKRINTILISFDQDIWRYISDEWIVQQPKAEEVGSSAMPHKVNPINFENSEGNLGLANALFTFFGSKLPIARLQRDLTDSTVERNFGTAFAHSLLGYKYMLAGLAKIKVNENMVQKALLSHTEVIAEAIQTVLRREKFPIPYERLKELTRGKQVTMADFAKFIKSLNIKPEVKKELLAIKPEKYIGMAPVFSEGI